MHFFVHAGLRGRAGMRKMGTTVASEMSGLCKFCTAFAGDASSSFRWLRGGLSAMRRGTQKRPRKRCIFRQSVVFLFFWAPDQSQRGQKGGNRREKNAPMGMQHFLSKIGGKSASVEAPRKRVFEPIFRRESARKCGCSWLAVCQYCTAFVYVLYRFTKLSRKGTPQA